MEHQEDILVQMMPSAYLSPIFTNGLCCKIGEVCEVAEKIWLFFYKEEKRFSPERFVHNYAPLTAPNIYVVEKSNTPYPKKLFRYSVDGINLQSKEVPQDDSAPPHKEFTLDIEGPYPYNLLVTEQWARDSLTALSQGCPYVMQWGEYVVGGTPPHERRVVDLRPTWLRGRHSADPTE